MSVEKFNHEEYQNEYAENIKKELNGLTTDVENSNLDKNDKKMQVRYEGEMKNGRKWNGKDYDEHGKVVKEYHNGKPILILYVSESKEPYIPEVKVEDLKNFDISPFFSKGGDKFAFTKTIDGVDSKGEYLNWNGKKIYKLGKNKDGIFYKLESKKVIFGEFKDGKLNGYSKIYYLDGSRYEGEIKNGCEWNGKKYNKDGNISVEYNNGHLLAHLYMSSK